MEDYFKIINIYRNNGIDKCALIGMDKGGSNKTVHTREKQKQQQRMGEMSK